MVSDTSNFEACDFSVLIDFFVNCFPGFWSIVCFYLFVSSGGDGKVGHVLDVRGWDQESGRSVANVTWAAGPTNVYRMGHKGKVDLKYKEPASGGFYFVDHLPVLGRYNYNY